MSNNRGECKAHPLKTRGELMNKEIEKLMKTLDISEEEAREIIEADKEIDRGAKLFELSDEQKKVEKQMRKTVKIVAPNGKKAERPLKIDPTRESLMQAITDALKDRTDAITRPEKTTNTMLLDIGADTFKIVVSKIRKK